MIQFIGFEREWKRSVLLDEVRVLFSDLVNDGHDIGCRFGHNLVARAEAIVNGELKQALRFLVPFLLLLSLPQVY